MTWRKGSARGYDDPGPGNTSPSTELATGSTTGPDSDGHAAGARPGYAETTGREARVLRRARVTAS